MMPNRQVVIGCNMLPQGKRGVLQRDADGYFLGVPMGAYNAVNSGGFLYDAPSAMSILSPNSVFMRMVQKGVLYSEYTHPEKLPGWSDGQYIDRIRRVDMKMACAHFRNVYVVDSRDENGRPIKLVLADIIPFGPYGQYVEQALTNPGQNSFFSVRSLTLDDRMTMTKYTREIVTWDWVGEGGILQANKYNAPSLEHFQETQVEITPALIWQLADEQKKLSGLGLESVTLNFEDLAKELGWQRHAPVIQRTPTYTRW